MPPTKPSAAAGREKEDLEGGEKKEGKARGREHETQVGARCCRCTPSRVGRTTGRGGTRGRTSEEREGRKTGEREREGGRDEAHLGAEDCLWEGTREEGRIEGPRTTPRDGGPPNGHILAFK